MAKQYGYAGKILRVDLTTERITETPTIPYATKFLGGRGLLAKLYWDEIPPGVDPLGPDNKLFIATGPITGTGTVASGKCEATAKSPVLNSFTTGNAGYIGPELKYAGYDALIIQGKSGKPVYLWINDGKVEIRSAVGLWGKTTRQTRNNLWDIHGSKTRVACIGPAGENMVAAAVISTDSNSAFGKGGLGAVMGSKNLKAIAVRGTGRLKVANPEKILQENQTRIRFFNLRPGETRIIDGKTIVGPVPQSPNAFTTSGIKVPIKLDDEAKLGMVRFKTGGCPGCALACRQKVDFADGSLPGGAMDCMEMFDWLVPEFQYYGGKFIGRVAWEATMLADDLGIDCQYLMCFSPQPLTQPYDVGFGGDWLYQGFLAGIFNQENTGLPWDKWGSREFMQQLLSMIAYREGIGDVIAQGPELATKYVVEHEKFGPNRKQMESIYRMVCPKPGKFGNPAWLHHLSFPVTVEVIYAAVGDQLGTEPEAAWWGAFQFPGIDDTVIKKWLGTDKPGDRTYWGPEVAQATIAHEHIAAITDSLVFCTRHDYGVYGPMMAIYRDYLDGEICEWKDLIDHSPNGAPEYLSAIFGTDVTWEMLQKQGEAIVNLVRAIWVRDGYTEDKYDTLHDEFFQKRDAKGNALLPEDKFQQTIQDYYQQRGWKEGVPTRAKLEELDIKDVADGLEALGKLPL